MNYRLITSLWIGILIFVGAFPGEASATVDHFQWIGFSEDGRSLAFSQSGLGNPSGYGFADYFFIDVPRNTFAVSPIHVQEDEGLSLEEALQKAQRAAAPVIEKLAIQKGNEGNHLYSSPLPLGTACENAMSAFSGEETVAVGPFKVHLKEFQASNQLCNTPSGPAAPVGLLLEILDANGKRISLLEEDHKIPKSRGCPWHYHLRDLYVKKGWVAALIDVVNPGFEACPSYKVIAITGQWPQKEL